ncbi:hypothetical protein EH227_15555 [Rouxiella chamberiensis]|nr:hypothetical protein EH227_15555 [Rouxiella chamberiensis]
MMRLAMALCLAILLVGCANQNKPLVTVKAISAERFAPKTYFLLPDNEVNANGDQLFFDQLAKATESNLLVQGFKRVNDIPSASQVIFLAYSRTGAINQTRNVTVPVFGQTGVSSATTYGTVNTNYSGYGNAFSTVNATTTYTPTYGITGAYNTQVTDTFYTIALRLTAIDYRKYIADKNINELWRVQAVLTSSQPDGLSSFKALISVAAEYADKTLERDLQFNMDPKVYGLE